MNFNDYASTDAIQLAQLIRSGQVSTTEVANAAFEAIERINPDINAVMETYPDRREGITDDIDKTATFYGVPFLLKDLAVHEKGRIQENGSRLFRAAVATHDTELMVRFRQAGLLTIGRTPTPEMGWNVTTEPLLTGPVRNPWNVEFMAGGSSGGSAAAVAAGIVPVAHATDGGGSIRIPASCCGLVGLKPTRGRTPTGPDMGEPVNGLGREFALSRTVRDAAALLDCVEGPGTGDYTEIRRPDNSYADAIHVPPEKLRIAVSTSAWSGTEVDKEIVKATMDAAALCVDMGHQVENKTPVFDHDAFLEATLTVWCANIAAGINAGAHMLGRKLDLDCLEATVRSSYQYGNNISAEQLLGALDVFNMIRRKVATFFTQYDVLLTPTLALLPQKLGTYDANDSRYTPHEWAGLILGKFAPFTALFNMTGQPALSLPLSRSNKNLPIGLQFVGRFGSEDTLLKLASQLEIAKPWPRVAPAYLNAQCN